MSRFTVMVALLCFCSTPVASASEPYSVMIVVSDRSAESTLPPLPPRARVLVLIQSKDEPDEVIHARALTMRHATHFVYRSGNESALAALYRERLTTHGALAIDLQRFSTRGSLQLLEATSLDHLLFASLFNIR